MFDIILWSMESMQAQRPFKENEGTSLFYDVVPLGSILLFIRT